MSDLQYFCNGMAYILSMFQGFFNAPHQGQVREGEEGRQQSSIIASSTYARTPIPACPKSRMSGSGWRLSLEKVVNLLFERPAAKKDSHRIIIVDQKSSNC